EPGDLAIGAGDDGSVVGQPRDDARERHAGRHVVVNADHVSAQAYIDRSRPIGKATAGSYVPVVVRHFSSLSMAGNGPVIVDAPATAVAYVWLNLVWVGLAR